MTVAHALICIVPHSAHIFRIFLAEGALMLTDAFRRSLAEVEERYLILWDGGPIYDENDNLYYEALDRASL